MTSKKWENLPATKGDVALVKADVALVKADVALVKGDIAHVKDDVALVKNDLALVKGDVAHVKDDITHVKDDVALLKNDLALAKTELRSEIASVKTELDQKIERVYLSQVQADSRLEKKIDMVISKLDKFYSDLMSVFERTVLKGEKYDKKADTHAGILMGHTSQLSDHEARIHNLEAAK